MDSVMVEKVRLAAESRQRALLEQPPHTSKKARQTETREVPLATDTSSTAGEL